MSVTLMMNPKVFDADDRHHFSLPEGYAILHLIVHFPLMLSDHILLVLVKALSNILIVNHLSFWIMKFTTQTKTRYAGNKQIEIIILMARLPTPKEGIELQVIGCHHGMIVQTLSKAITALFALSKSRLYIKKYVFYKFFVSNKYTCIQFNKEISAAFNTYHFCCTMTEQC